MGFLVQISALFVLVTLAAFVQSEEASSSVAQAEVTPVPLVKSTPSTLAKEKDFDSDFNNFNNDINRAHDKSQDDFNQTLYIGLGVFFGIVVLIIVGVGICFCVGAACFAKAVNPGPMVGGVIRPGYGGGYQQPMMAQPVTQQSGQQISGPTSQTAVPTTGWGAPTSPA